MDITTDQHLYNFSKCATPIWLALVERLCSRGEFCDVEDSSLICKSVSYIIRRTRKRLGDSTNFRLSCVALIVKLLYKLIPRNRPIFNIIFRLSDYSFTRLSYESLLHSLTPDNGGNTLDASFHTGKRTGYLEPIN